jgi:hypothetical protein
VNASGAATLGGAVAFSTPAIPAPSAAFQFLTYASRTGRFDAIEGHEIEPGRSFSVHYNNTRALAIAGEWAASGASLVGDVDVPAELLVTGSWLWNGTLIKWGEGDLVLDLSGGFTANATASLAIVEGRVLLQGSGHSLTLDNLHYGELGALSGNPALSGQYGWYGQVAVPDPAALPLFALATALALHRRRDLPFTRMKRRSAASSRSLDADPCSRGGRRLRIRLLSDGPNTRTAPSAASLNAAIVPHAKGGSNCDANVQLLCRGCNAKKSDLI